MSTVIASSTLANGLRMEFTDTYTAINNRQQDGRLSTVMDLGVGATNRKHEFAYFEAAPHMEQWRRGEAIPTDGMDSVDFSVTAYTWGRRVPWHNEDREDDQTTSLFEVARTAGASAALLPERFFFDILSGTATTLPAVPLAPDGAALFATTAGGSNRFGVANGNLLTGTGVASVSSILTDYYSGITQFRAMQDGKGQPLWIGDLIDQGVTIIYPSGHEKAFDEAFRQLRQGMFVGTDAGVTPSNVVIDSSRTVNLWSSNRLTGDDWYMFLSGAPKKPIFLMDRRGIIEQQSLFTDNNSDYTRTLGIEYVQWSRRAGAGISLPYGVLKINN